MAYVYGKPQVKRIFGTGDYSGEWIDIRRAKMHDAEALSTGGKRNADILALLIVDWSIVDEQGEKLPISGDVLNELPIEISMPALTYFNEIFLPLTALAVASSSTPKLAAGVTTEYPDDLVFAQMCDRFHKLPSELMKEDYGDLMRVWTLLTQYEAANNKIAEQRSKR